MKFKSTLGNVTVAAALLLAAGARAETFSGAYSEAYDGMAGLQIATDPLQAGSALNFTLTPGQSTTVALFDLYTPETTVNGDDTVPQAISTLFSFSGASDTSIGGSTVGVKDTDGNEVFGIPGNHQYGQVTWDGTETVAFSDGSKLDVSLNDARFNEGEYYALNYGSYPYSGTAESNGADISATFTLEGGVAGAPEPATWALMMISVGAVGYALRRARVRHQFTPANALSS